MTRILPSLFGLLLVAAIGFGGSGARNSAPASGVISSGEIARPGHSVATTGTLIGKKVQKQFSVTGEENVHTMSPSNYRYPTAYSRGPGDSIGFTTYDYGTNGSANHNVINYGDGAVSIGRMAAQQPATPDRGTWYSHSTNRGLAWRPLAKVEAAANRRGWGNIDQFRDPAAAGIEATVSHTGLEVNVDAVRGGGAWGSSSTASTATATWPRLAIGGGFNLHIIAGAGNPPAGFVYTRSTDAGLSFNQVDQPVLATATASADGWDIAARGNTVVVLATPQAAGADVVINVSTNNGTTWTTRVVYDVAGPGELPAGQQQPQPDGSGSVVIDNAGTIHVTWGNFMAVGNRTNDPETFYSFQAGPMYWNSVTGQRTMISQAPVQDTSIVNEQGAPGHDGNFATQPDIGYDATGNLYVVFSSLTAGRDAAGLFYEHVYASRSTNGGTSWSRAVDITPGTGFDAAFPSLADLVDTHLYILYNSDALAGNAIQTNHPENQTAIMWLRVPVSALVVGVNEGDGLPAAFKLEQNYPNPFNPETKIAYTVAKAGPVSLRVYNMLGQEVATLVNGNLQPGTHQVTFDAGNLPSGVYFYTMTAGIYSETKRMLLLK